MIRLAPIFILLFFSATISSAQDTLRCGSKIVKTGMSMDDVLKYCGMPDSKEIEEHDVRSGNRVTGVTEMHIWTYNRGSSGAPAVLEFDVEKLMSISTRKK
jgi:hypothetical protein